MRDVGALWSENEFGVRRDLDVARSVAQIRDRDAPNFRVVLRRYEHIQSCPQEPIAARDFGAVLIKYDVVVIRFNTSWLKTSRPTHPGPQVLYVYIETEVVAGGVFAPASEGQIAPATVARSGCGQHGGVAAIR